MLLPALPWYAMHPLHGYSFSTLCLRWCDASRKEGRPMKRFALALLIPATPFGFDFAILSIPGLSTGQPKEQLTQTWEGCSKEWMPALLLRKWRRLCQVLNQDRMFQAEGTA